jgi:hypothetical protein
MVSRSGYLCIFLAWTESRPSLASVSFRPLEGCAEAAVVRSHLMRVPFAAGREVLLRARVESP